MQTDLVAGDSLNFCTAVPEYGAGAGWALKYRLVPRNAAHTVIEITAAAEGDDYRVQVPPVTTATWSADTYGWASWVEKSGERYTISSGSIVVRADPATIAAGFDTRTSARVALDNARAARDAWNPTQRRYKIGEREREFNSVAEILKLIAHLETEVLKEDRLAGRVPKIGRRIYTRM